MTNVLKIDYANKTLVMDRTFSKNAKVVGSREYNLLQQAKRENPELTVITKQIKKNANKECYKGLTYDRMRDYILTHEPSSTKAAVLHEFDEMILISKCHSNAFRYPVIKRWFLAKYTEIRDFGMATIPNPSDNSIVTFNLAS